LPTDEPGVESGEPEVGHVAQPLAGRGS
jgi:hypothetical protein